MATLGVSVLGATFQARSSGGQEHDIPGLPSTGQLLIELVDSPDVTFFFPSDPEFIVIQYHGGRYSGTPLLRVSGDGTVRAYQERPSYRGDPSALEEHALVPAGIHTVQLSFSEVDDLVRSLLDTGILGFEEESAQARLGQARLEEQQRSGTVHMSSEVSVHEIVLRFEEFRFSSESEPVRDYESRVVWRERDLSLDRAVELYPEIAELGRLLDAVIILSDLHEETVESWSAE